MLAFVAWGQSFDWQFSVLNSYLVFPFLGLLAWSIMWTHYFSGALVLLRPHLTKDLIYKKISYWLVLFLILLHPGLLSYAEWDRTGKLPPGSDLNYVDDSLRFYVVLGIVALAAFLLYEAVRHLADKPQVKRQWGWISLSQMLAMVLIFIHSLQLGSQLQTGWFHYYWWTLGILLLPCFFIVGRADWSKTKPSK